MNRAAQIIRRGLDLERLINSLSISGAPVPCGVVVAAAVVAGATDLYAFTVANWLTIPLMAGGVAYHSFVPDAEGFWFGFGGAMCGLLILMPIYLVGGIGAGDVKLLSGIGAWLGMLDFLSVFVVTAVLSGVYSVVLMLVTGSGRRRLANLLPRRLRRSEPRERIEELARKPVRDQRKLFVPFASMVALALVILLWSRAYGLSAGERTALIRQEHGQVKVQISQLSLGYEERAGATSW